MSSSHYCCWIDSVPCARVRAPKTKGVHAASPLVSLVGLSGFSWMFTIPSWILTGSCWADAGWVGPWVEVLTSSAFSWSWDAASDTAWVGFFVETSAWCEISRLSGLLSSFSSLSRLSYFSSFPFLDSFSLEETLDGASAPFWSNVLPSLTYKLLLSNYYRSLY